MKRFRLFTLAMLLLSLSLTSLSLGCRASGEVSDEGVDAGLDVGE